MAELLLVEDNQKLALTLRDRLRALYALTIVSDGQSGIDAAIARTFDCIILDVGLPTRSGFDVCRELRQRNVQTPILMLTGRSDVLDRVHGLNLGADDYLTKPFEMAELLARIAALLRRAPDRKASTPDAYDFGGLAVDFRRMRVARDGVAVSLSELELRLLRYLIEHRGSVVSRDELLAKVWRHDELPLTRTVDVRVASLRQKIERDPTHPQLIVTMHGIGYKFIGT